MRVEIIEASDVLWLDDRHELSLTELAALSGLSVVELHYLMACEALLPLPAVEPAAQVDITEARFSAECIALARTASRMRDDFELDTNGLALTLRLLKRIHELEAELIDLRAQRPR
jgi:chaperone modulatory protein CbpM